MSQANLGISRRVVGFALILAITACTTQRLRPETISATRPLETLAPSSPANIDQQLAAEKPAEIAALSLWDRLRTRFAMDGCAYSEAVPREALRYTRSPEHFNASWQEAIPSLLLVLSEIERRDLPGEFALLPYVESQYRSLPAKGKGPAGIWQLMSRTAIDQGLHVSDAYDQRLDILASTDVALSLIERYDREFSDWRLASMAFNAGEFRVKRALREVSTTSLDAQRLARLKLTATTHQHLLRLLALSCIVSEPERFGVNLPKETAEDLLVEVTAPAAIDLRLAASLAGLGVTDVLRHNAAWSGQVNPRGPSVRLLLPRMATERLNLALTGFPEDMLGDWHTQHIAAAVPLTDLAATLGIAPDLLAMANRLDPHSQLQPGQLMLLPGAERPPNPALDREVHAIKPGDTLSRIARRYRVRLEDLLRWNEMTTRSILRPGSTLRIHAPSY